MVCLTHSAYENVRCASCGTRARDMENCEPITRQSEEPLLAGLVSLLHTIFPAFRDVSTTSALDPHVHDVVS
jgi:hypothetical protein